MRKIVLLFAIAALMVAAFGVVPTAAKKQKEDRGGMTSTDNKGNDVSDTVAEVANEYDSQRFPVMYAVDESAAATPEPAATAKTPTKQSSSKQHNAKLLNRLGMKRVRTTSGSAGDNSGANHHRKRLASQSRSKYAADGKGGSDSQMFIVKLPPHSHFYDDGSAVHQRLGQPHQQVPYKNLNTVPVGFMSNGKPAKVYHWNLPTIKHALSGGRYKGVNDMVTMQQQQQQMQQQMHHMQHAQAGDFELPSSSSSKILPRRTLYYKPRGAGKPVKKSFVNNGKPNGFYVVSSKNSAAVVPQYHKIIKAYYGSADD
ncbi:uncharacterized protein LOC132939396 [Metopolophium dirhodum]|uniref:uncharacterized protein LOC132939396 n=1 Tax=Metopolophium dirhodum TaxID=44670 RepID=UPI00298FBA60|nr:uncharacterized protein LOC132939396 [Metopolophium dirhodum]